MDNMTSVKKPSQVMAWLGFGISLAVLLMVWGVNLLAIINAGNAPYPIAAIYVLLFFVGGLLGILGLVFSIVGLVNASKHFMKKWPGVYGIIFCCLSIFSLFTPLVFAGFISNQTMEVKLPRLDVEEYSANNDIVLQITRHKKIKCYDNRNGEDCNPAVISVYSPDIKHELQTWMQMNEINTDAPFIIEAETNADYSDVVDVIDALKSLGIKQYRMQSKNEAV